MVRLATKVVSGLLVVVGTVLILSSSSGITGYTIIEEAGKPWGSLIGIVFIIWGFVLLESRIRRERVDY